MATPPHHHHQPQSCCCCFNCSSHSQPLSHSQPCYSHSSQPTPSDQLLQSIATHLSQLSSLSSSNLKSTQQNHDHHQQTQTLLLQSLHHRISSLESSLQTLSSSSSPPPPKPTTPFSLRDLAARTIQIHFRSFLVRRSQTLRHLKDLASIRSQLNNLKAPLSDKTQLAILFQKTEPYSQKAMELLYKLDSIQIGDVMIKEGKRSVRRELVGFLKFLDSLNIKNRSTSKRRAFNYESSLEDLTLDGKDCEEDKEAILENLSRNGVFESDHGASKVVFEQKYGLDAKIVESKNGNLGLFAPLPLKMEDPASSDFVERKMRGGFRVNP